MNQLPPNSNQPEKEEPELSQDQELWNLLDKGSSPETNPLFSRNVLREIRVQESDHEANTSFWRAFFRPRVLVASSFAAMAFAAVALWNPPNNNSSPSMTKQPRSATISPEFASSLESSLESELLLAAADTPELFSDEEVIAMLF